MIWPECSDPISGLEKHGWEKDVGNIFESKYFYNGFDGYNARLIVTGKEIHRIINHTYKTIDGSYRRPAICSTLVPKTPRIRETLESGIGYSYSGIAFSAQ